MSETHSTRVEDTPTTSSVSALLRRISEMPPRTVVRICQALIAIHLVLRTVVFGSGYFYLDDYILMGRAARLGLFSEELLTDLHKGHLMPGGMFVSGVLERIAPLNYWAVLAFLVLMQFLATWLTYRLLRQLIGPRPALLIPVLILTLTPLTLLPGSWYSAAINLLPLQIAAAAGGIAMVRGIRGGSRGWFILVAVALAAGLLFFEKSVLLPIAYLAIAIASGPAGGSTVQVVTSAMRRTWLVWLLVVPLVIGYLIYYLDRAADQARDLSDTAAIVIQAATAVARGLIPSLFGGPVTWNPVGFGTASADPSLWIALFSCLLIAAIAAYGIWQSARSRAVWLLAMTYVFLDIVIMVLGRAGFGVITDLGLTLRYTADSLVIILVAIAITFAPSLGHADALHARQTRRRARSFTARTPAVHAAVGIITITLVAASIASHVALIGPLSANDSRNWLTNIRGSVATQFRPIRILDGDVPAFVMDALNFPYNDYSWTLAPLSAEVKVQPAIYTSHMFDETGRLVPARVAGIDSLPGPNGDCGWGVRLEPVQIALAGDVFEWEHTMRIAYLASAAHAVDIQLGDSTPVRAELREGAGEILLTIVGGGPTVTVTPTQTEHGVCIAQVQVGALVPAN